MLEPMTRPDVYAALDTSDLERARTLARDLAGIVDGFKVGLQLFYAHGGAAVRMVAGHGLPIFLDLKLHDIPNTVAGAIKSLSPLGVKYVTIHAGGGLPMLEAAAEAATANAGPAGAIGLLGVTVLTSLNDDELAALGAGDGSAAPGHAAGRDREARGLRGHRRGTAGDRGGAADRGAGTGARHPRHSPGKQR